MSLFTKKNSIRKNKSDQLTADQSTNRDQQLWQNFQNKKKKIKLIVLTLTLVFASAATTLSLIYTEPLLSPLSSLTTFQFLGQVLGRQTENRLVYAFLPYWNLNKASIQPEITNLAYFSLGIDGNGKIKISNEDSLEPGFNKMNSDELMALIKQLKSNKNKYDLVLTQFDNDEIVNLISNNEAQDNLLESLDSLLLAYPIKGINIDIEYSGEVNTDLRNKYTAFIRKIRQHLLNKYTKVQLSIDVYASAASKELIWDIRALAPEVDYIVVMAYDFHRRSSAQAGPVAPLFGGKDFWEGDVNQYLKDFIRQTPREKILLGVPFYGYGWQTDSDEAQANTYPTTGFTATYQYVTELIKKKAELNLKQHWHETALSPYITYQEKNEETGELENYIIYYENARSLGYKMEYVKELNLAGIAIWALGYEGDGSRDLWEVVRERI